MAIFELFSRRKKKSKNPTTDVYKYEEIPSALRVQIVQIIRDTIGENSRYNTQSQEIYNQIHRVLCKEFSVFKLHAASETVFESIYNYFLETKNYEQCLDVIEISFYMISTYVKDNEWKFRGAIGKIQNAIDAIEELNYRFNEAGIGYQFNNGQLIQIDSQFIHSETIKPTLKLLSSDEIYQGANDEFLKAHEHYRHKRYKECLNECLKSLESTMKAIHIKLSWPYNQHDTAKTLINNLLTNGLVPNYLQNQLSAIRSILESGTPTIRNKEAGHGQGIEIKDIPEHFASYMLHLTASNILFIANSAKNYS